MVDFSGGWDTLWGAVAGDLGGLMTILTVVGALMVIFSLLAWVYSKRRGGGAAQGMGGQFIVLFIGAVLAAPQALIPALLTIVDWIANALIAFFERVS